MHIGRIFGMALVLLACGSSAQARLQQERLSLPVQVTDANGQSVAQHIVVRLAYDDASRKPMPVAVINHGRPADGRVKAGMGMAAFPAATDFFVKRGYIVAVPTRIGYGVTGGPDVEASGNCTRRNFAPGFKAAATQILATLTAVRQRPGVAQDGAVLAGHSYGGVAALAAAAQQSAGVGAVINVSGGAGGDAKDRPGQPCSTFQLAQQLRQFGQSSRVPSLWLYAENDRYFGNTVPRQWFEAYQGIGGVAEWVSLPPAGADGHALFTHFPGKWQPVVAGFLARQQGAATALSVRSARPQSANTH